MAKRKKLSDSALSKELGVSKKSIRQRRTAVGFQAFAEGGLREPAIHAPKASGLARRAQTKVRKQKKSRLGKALKGGK